MTIIAEFVITEIPIRNKYINPKNSLV